MLTYSFEERKSCSLYEYLYQQIKEDILEERLQPNEKLPSKRALAKHLNISTITVENAYTQLVAEGYLYSKPKSGFFVSPIISGKAKNPAVQIHFSEQEPAKFEEPYFADFVSNSTPGQSFPFALWVKLMRKIMSDHAEKLMVSSPSSGVWELRVEIAKYLLQFRGMNISPEQIVVGAGTEYLYGMIIQLLGHNKIYGMEEPGYQKITKICEANEVHCIHLPMDENGVDAKFLENSPVQVLHISPSHHFPTGIITPIGRRYELLSWASKSNFRYIIEDDYDSEFRFMGKPIPSLQSIDMMDKVIYINTFSKSLSPTIRISYMVLPKELMKKYEKNLNFYSCTVPNFEQYTLAAFLAEGHFEKHINRMRNYYRNQRDQIMNCIKNHPKYDRIRISEENSGLHFLLHVDTPFSDQELAERAKKNHIHISCLSQYFFNTPVLTLPHTLLINYSGISSDKIPKAVELLFDSLWDPSETA